MVPSIQKTSDLVQEITAASDEQRGGVAQINSAVNLLSQTTQQNAAGSEELAATAEEMSGQAEELQSAIAFFKVSPKPAAAIVRQPTHAVEPLHRAAARSTPSNGRGIYVDGGPDETSFVNF
jgi:methyl-accepting chemotaxis protein